MFVLDKVIATMTPPESRKSRTELAPMTEDYLDKLEHICGAVAHRVYEKQGTWFPGLKKKVPTTGHALLTARYKEEFNPYLGTDWAG
jgi:hypothetical protein